MLGPADYDPAQAPAERFARDSAECEMVAAQSQNTGGLPGAWGVLTFREKRNRVYDPCMRAKGYPRK